MSAFEDASTLIEYEKRLKALVAERLRRMLDAASTRFSRSLRQAMTWTRVMERNSAMPRKPATAINSSLHSDE
jgi:hypothetical protein